MTGVFAFLFALSGMFSQGSRMPTDRITVGIGAFRTEVATDNLIKATKAAGIDFVSSYEAIDIKVLDMLEREGLGCICGGFFPHWWGGKLNGLTNGKMHELHPLAYYEKRIGEYVDHPAIWALDIGDEPSALDFEHFGRVADMVGKGIEKPFPAINLFPIYALPGGNGKTDAAKSMLGVPTYQQYIAEYCKYVPLDYIRTDIYPWGWSVRRGQLFENLRIVADAALATGREMTVYLQQNRCIEGGYTNRAMTANTMRFQVYSAMAYGARSITWCCWTDCWWKDNFIEQGKVNPVAFERLKAVNDEIHAFSPVYARFKRISTDLVSFRIGSKVDMRGDIRQPFVRESSGSAFSDVRTMDDSELAVGHMVARDGSGDSAIFVAAVDDPEDEGGIKHILQFRAQPGEVRIYAPHEEIKGERTADGYWLVPIRSNRALMIVLTRK